MKQNVILLYKKLGETPLDTITRYKAETNLDNNKLSFAGRLDPMAEGLLLVLRDEENRKRQTYEALTKTYECSFVCGFATDTYDLLGKVTKIANTLDSTSELRNQITSYITTLPGKKIQTYPPFSSYHIKGKPLYYWERRGELDHTNLPSKEIIIHQAVFLRDEILPKKMLEEEILRRLLLVTGNFRQEEIGEGWKEAFKKCLSQKMLQTHLRITCSSGTYIRGLVQESGKKIGTPTVTTSILRAQIGSFSLKDLSWHTP